MKGKLGGMNLSYEKARLLSEIGLIEQRLSLEKNSKSRQELLFYYEEAKKDLELVEHQIEQENLKHGHFMKLDDEEGKYAKLEEIEKQRQTEEWLKEQEYFALNPEAKRNNIFMKLNREDSVNLTEADKQKLKMQKELELNRMRS